MTSDQQQPTVEAARKALSGAIRGYYLLGLDTGVLGLENPATGPIERWERRIGEAQDALDTAIRADERAKVTAEYEALLESIVKWEHAESACLDANAQALCRAAHHGVIDHARSLLDALHQQGGQ